MNSTVRAVAAAVVIAGVSVSARSAEETASLVQTIKAVGERGEGNVAAAQAQRELAKADAAELPAILQAFDGAGPLASNWLRGAVETIADRTVKSGGKLPESDLVRFINDRKQVPRARRLAFELLQQVNADKAEQLVPPMLNDPSPELRREAVARLIDQAEKLEKQGKQEEAQAVYQKALSGAVADDQVKAIVGPLKKLGTEVDLPLHFGFLTDWLVIGPFDNSKGVGFATVYPPEKEIDLNAAYKGQLDQVKWQPIATDHEYGIVDIAEEVKNYKGSVMYLTTEFVSAKKQTVQIRLGTPNSWKLWVNGKLRFAREEYHRGMKLDQYKVESIDLKSGPNTILLKLCQNEQDDSWAQRYQFQLRVCNSTGSAVLPQGEQNTSTNEPAKTGKLVAR